MIEHHDFCVFFFRISDKENFLELNEHLSTLPKVLTWGSLLLPINAVLIHIDVIIFLQKELWIFFVYSTPKFGVYPIYLCKSCLTTFI